MLNIGSRKRLFIDDRFVREPRNAALAVNSPAKAGPVSVEASTAPSIVEHEGVCYLYQGLYGVTSLGPERCNFGDENAVHAEMLSRLGEIACPTLLLPGQHDVSSPLEYVGGMARTIRGCEVKVIPRARHFPSIGEPQLFIAAIRPFRAEHSLVR